MSSLNDTELLNGGILDIFDHLENSSDKKVSFTRKSKRARTDRLLSFDQKTALVTDQLSGLQTLALESIRLQERCKFLQQELANCKEVFHLNQSVSDTSNLAQLNHLLELSDFQKEEIASVKRSVSVLNSENQRAATLLPNCLNYYY